MLKNEIKLNMLQQQQMNPSTDKIQPSNKFQRHVANYIRIKHAKEVKLKKLQSDFQTYNHPYNLYYEDEAEIVEYRCLEKKIRLLQEDIQYLDEEFQAFKIRNHL